MDYGFRQKLEENMDTMEFTKHVKLIPLDLIEPNPGNPRGVVETDASFERLVSSINEVGILVPLVVRQLGPSQFQLVDGERRYLAAKKLRIPRVPTHVLLHGVDTQDLRRYMFHLHMTREQWEPLAQCKSLAEMYPEVDTWMNARTARDRVHVLSWPKPLKKKIFAFDKNEPDRDIYSYVLAIEASIVEPSARTYVDFYNHGRPIDKRANEVRASLFDKTINGIEIGLVTSRDQIRSVEPLFQAQLNEVQLRVAVKIFGNLVDNPKFTYDDAFAQIETTLPELLAERPPKPQKLIGSIRSLSETLRIYKPEYVDGIQPEATSRKLKRELSAALDNLTQAARKLKDGLR